MVARTASSTITSSVISSVSRVAGSPESSSAEATRSTTRRSASSLLDRFTATEGLLSGHVDSSTDAKSWQARRSDASPIVPSSPVAIASPRKASGPSRPRSGCCQRSSASTLTISPEPRSMIGW